MSRVIASRHKPNRGLARQVQSHEVNSMNKGGLARLSHVGTGTTEDGMSSPHALAALAALGQPTRLDILRLLIRRGPHGLLASGIAEAVGCPHNTVSSHLSILARAGLIRGTRDGRTILYRADVKTMQSLLSFLLTDCCNGHPEICDLESAIHNVARPCSPIGGD